MMELQKRCYDIAKKRGFYGILSERTEETKAILHLIDEVHELSEAYSCNRFADADPEELTMRGFCKDAFELFAKDSVQHELADIVILVNGISEKLGIDLQKWIEIVLKYNEVRDE